MKTKTLSFVASLIILRISFCQEFTLSGFVEDGETGERLIGANVFDPTEMVGTTSNVYGFFSLTVKKTAADSMSLVVSYIGYEPWQSRLVAGEDQEVHVRLKPRVISMDSVTVVAQNLETIESKTGMSAIEIPIQQLKLVPALLGEVDVIKSIQLLPGVQSGAEGSSGLYVRGGAPDQNLILLDGAPVYNASHLFGFFSVFNSDAVKNVKLTKGGFPARFGDRLSSVVEINMKDGNNQNFNGQATLGLISSRLMLEGPLKKGSSSFIISARRTYADLLVKPFLDDDENGGYYFADLNAKVNHTLSSRNRFYLSLYTGLDKFYFRSRENQSGGSYLDDGNLRWGNVTSTLRWNFLITNKLFSNTTLIYSKYRFTVDVEETSRRTSGDVSESYFLEYISGIEDYGARIDLDLRPNPGHYIKFGGTVTAHKFSPGAAQFKVTGLNISDLDTLVAPTRKQNASAASIYLEDEVRLADAVKANAGIRASVFATGSRRFLSVQPRLSARLLIGSWAFKTSYAKMNQHIHLLSNVGVGLPTDLWVPSTENVKPQKSQQVAFGVARSFRQNRYELSAECYYKTMDNLIEYKEGADFAGLDVDWQNKVETGSGRSYGAELFVQKKYDRITGWLGYTLSWSDRRFENISLGKRFPSRYDRRNDVSLTFNYQLSESVQLSGTWVYGTGNAISLPVATYPVEPQILSYSGNPDEEIEYLPVRNSLRMRAYHRLDLAIQFIKHKGIRERVLTVGLYNAYSRRNPFFYFFSNDQTGNPVVKQISLFPIIPAVSYRFEF